jgi:L-lactate dehydrogenase complex protein LldG
MNQAKQNILERLRAANPVIISQTDLPYRPWGESEFISETAMVERFTQALIASHAEVLPIEAAQISDTLRRLASQKSWSTAAIGSGGEWLNEFRQGLDVVRVTQFSQPIEAWKSELFTDIDVGVTHVLAGIADTGALVLWPNEEEPRTLSLVPPCHVAVIKQSTLRCNFPQIIQEQHWVAQMPTNAILISGPSKTADIQQTLAYGAHGPSELIVLLIKDQ